MKQRERERERVREKKSTARTLKRYWQVNFNSMDALSYLPYTGYDRLLCACVCLCTVLKFRRARNNMVQQSDRREYEKKINRLEMCLSIYTERMNMESIRYFHLCARSKDTYTHTRNPKPICMGVCTFFSLCSRCIVHAAVVVVVNYLCVYRYLESERQRKIEKKIVYRSMPLSFRS